MFEALRFYNKNIHCIIVVVVVVGKYTSALTQLFVVGVFGTKDVNFTLACFWPCNFKTKHKHFRKRLCGLALKKKGKKKTLSFNVFEALSRGFRRFLSN